MREKLRTAFQTIKKEPWLAATLSVVAVFGFLRVWRLNLPGETVFDEVYFPDMAHKYLTGETFFDIHPPLGKLLIALGELVFGNTTLGWRIMPLLAGLAMLPVAYWAMTQLFADKRAGYLAMLLLSVDGLFIVYSRTGLMDIFMLLFGLLSVGFCWQFRKARLTGQAAFWSLFLTGVFAGLAVAVKWIGVGFLPLVGVTTLLTIYQTSKRDERAKDIIIWVGSLILIPTVLYTLPFLANWQTNFWSEFKLWHIQSWGYNINLDATHPYAAKWWGWPFLVRPIWFYYKNIEGLVYGVDAIGNPIVWWGSTLAVVYTAMTLFYTLIALVYSAWVWKKSDHEILERRFVGPLIFLLAGWAIFYLPWSVVGRVLFLYHYFASYLFALLLTSFWLGQAFQSSNSRVILSIALLAAIATAIAFAPIWIAYPIPQFRFDNLMWFTSWI